MSIKRNSGTLIAGSVLIGFGLLALLGQVFRGVEFWRYLWPIFLVAVGAMFFVGMFAGGRSMAALAIPGSIVGMIGLMMLVQSLTDHWESWAYGWTVILISVGLGIFIMGVYSADETRRQAGKRVMWIGLILFIIFGGFFEMLFNSFQSQGIGRFVFPVLMVLLGLYLVVIRSGLLPLGRKNSDDGIVDLSSEKK
jgi:MFS family permease